MPLARPAWNVHAAGEDLEALLPNPGGHALIETSLRCCAASACLREPHCETTSVTIGACSSPSRVAPGPILATLGIRSSLAPNLHCRPTCFETPTCISRTFGFLGSHRSNGFQSHDHLPHHAHSTSPELTIAGTFNLPTGDQRSLAALKPGRIWNRTFVENKGIFGRKVLDTGAANPPVLSAARSVSTACA